MLSVLLDVRRARQRRWTLVALTACALASSGLSRAIAPLAKYTGSPSVLGALLAGASLVAAVSAAFWSKREAHWTFADDLAWLIALPSLSMLAALATAPLSLPALLFALTAVSLAVRVPPGRLVAATAASCLVAPLARAALKFSPDSSLTLALFSTVVLVAHVTLARATHALAYVLAEREALLQEKRTHTRGRSVSLPPADHERTRSVPVAENPDLSTVEPNADDIGWEALVERVRTSIATLCDAAGVEASVRADVQGLAPPSQRMRANVLKIAQEAANHALRDSSPTSIEITLRRGDGGLLLEVHDNGAVGENVRLRKTLASVRGRVIPMGGSAELTRADVGWVVRVRLPCEQLN